MKFNGPRVREPLAGVEPGMVNAGITHPNVHAAFPSSTTPVSEALCAYDFMECGKCGRLCTKREMERALGVEGSGRACPCGSTKYQPTNPSFWQLWQPKVLIFAVYRLIDGLRGWRTVRSRCLKVECGHQWQAVFQRGTNVRTLECPRCHGTNSEPVNAVSFGDAPAVSA